MQMLNGYVESENENGDLEKEFLMTYSEDERQQNAINKENAKLVFAPMFVPLFLEQKKAYELSWLETALLGFIWFYLGTGTDKRFYFTNPQLALMFDVTDISISKSIKRLKEHEFIKVGYKIKAGGGTIRFIEKVSPDLNKSLSLGYKKLKGNNNKINNNKINIYVPFEKQIEQYVDKYSVSMIREFTDHFTEKTSSGKELWQTFKAWDIGRRLARWKRQQEKWDWEKSQKAQLKSVNEMPTHREVKRTCENSGFEKIGNMI